MEIKFRVWCKNKKQWENDYTFINDIGTVFHQNETGYTVNLSHKTHIVEQFTGLKDKDGKEIYEGDVLSVRDRYNDIWSSNGAEVIFSNEYVGGWVISSGGQNLNLGSRQNDLKIIGNIHENPELLTNKG